MPSPQADPFDDIYYVMDSMDTNLGRIISSRQALDEEYHQIILWQIISGMAYFHALGLEHRDIKPCNILINKDIYVKTCDFGLSRQRDDMEGDQKEADLQTQYVVTRYYRAPEVIHSQGRYSDKLDVWAVGCCLAELMTKKILFQGNDSATQLQQIIYVLGTPEQYVLDQMDVAAARFVKKMGPIKKQSWDQALDPLPPYAVKKDALVLDLLDKLLQFDPVKRISMAQALKHPWFDSMFKNKHFQVLTQRYGLQVDFQPPARVNWDWETKDISEQELVDRMYAEAALFRTELLESNYFPEKQKKRVTAIVKQYVMPPKPPTPSPVVFSVAAMRAAESSSLPASQPSLYSEDSTPHDVLKDEKNSMEKKKGVFSTELYEVLGVSKEASEAEIKTAYKKLAMKWHPDKNTDRAEEAQVAFVNISTAYSVLSDKEKRKRYDALGAAYLDQQRMTEQEATELASRLFRSIFSWGYPAGQEAAAPDHKHGLEQAVKGSMGAPVLGAAAGVGALGAGAFVGAGHILGGVIEGVMNLGSGVKEMGMSMTSSGRSEPSDKHSGSTPPPSFRSGLTKATVGFVGAPLQGVGMGLRAIAGGAVGGVVAAGAGLKGAYTNIQEGSAEMNAAAKREKDTGVPMECYHGDSIPDMELTSRLRDILSLEDGEKVELIARNVAPFDKTADRLVGASFPTEQEKQKEWEEVTDMEELLVKKAEYRNLVKTQSLMAECIVLTPYRLATIRHGSVRRSVLREDIRAARQYKSGIKTVWERLAVTLQDGSEAQFQIYSKKLTKFLLKILRADLVHFDPTAPLVEVQPTGDKATDKMQQIQRDLQVHKILTLAPHEKLQMHEGRSTAEGWLVTNARFLHVSSLNQKKRTVTEDIPRQCIQKATHLAAFSAILAITLRGDFIGDDGVRKYNVSSDAACKTLAKVLNLPDSPSSPLAPSPMVCKAKGPRHLDGNSTDIYEFSAARIAARKDSVSSDGKSLAGSTVTQVSPTKDSYGAGSFASGVVEQTPMANNMPGNLEDGPVEMPTAEAVEELD
eukprot:gb/GEZN01000596.1/.p1 GENE.gb/GEZN01000596.1/~~gb/GEZN01000596.1/.p1  ORF type:complete len:1166 (-),score=255.26 gb/GEZN01000596.1/:561-3659(-)